MAKQIILFAFLLLSLTACRVRVIDVLIEYESTVIEEPMPYEQPPTPDYIPEEPEPVEKTPDETPEQTQEFEDEPYDSPGEIIQPEIEPTAYVPLQIETPTYDAPTGTHNGDESAPILAYDPPGPEESQYITIETPTDAPGETTLDDDGDGTLGLIIDRYTGILNRGLGSLFECQRVYVYFERLEDFRTVNRNSPEHNLILDSGGRNVAERRGNDALIVDTDWVIRRNPEVILRTVSASILGPGVADTTQAAAIRSELLARPGLENISAVINRRVLLLSDALFQSEEGRLIAKLHIAHTMYPTLFSDVNIAEIALQIKESGGRDYTYSHFIR